LNLLTPLGKEFNLGEAWSTYLSRRKIWEAISKVVPRYNKDLIAYSFNNRCAYCGHNRPKADRGYEASK